MTPEQHAANTRARIDEWIERDVPFARAFLDEWVHAAERPTTTMTTGTTKETAMTTNPLTPTQQRRAQAVKDAKAAIAGGFATVKDPTHIVWIADYILNGLPDHAAEAKAKEREKADREKREADAAAWAAATRWPFYGAAPQRWYTGGLAK